MQHHHIQKKKWIFALPQPPSPHRRFDPGIQTKTPFDIYCSSAFIQKFGKKINDNYWTKLLQYLNIWPSPRGKVGEVKFLVLPCILTFSEKLSDIIGLGTCEVHYTKSQYGFCIITAYKSLGNNSSINDSILTTYRIWICLRYQECIKSGQ